MPNWNGLGYQQLAMQGIENKKARSGAAWASFVDNMNKIFATQQAQDWQTGTVMPQQQGYAKDIQTQSDVAAMNRQNVSGEQATGIEKLRQAFEGSYNLTAAQQIARDAADRAARVSGSGAATPERPDFWTEFVNASKGFELKAGRPFDPTQDTAELRKAFIAGLTGNPNRDSLVKSFDDFMAADTKGATSDLIKIGAKADTATNIVNAIRNNPLVGGLADMILTVFTTTRGGQNIVAAKNWLNKWFPGRLGDKLWPTAGTPGGSAPDSLDVNPYRTR